MNSIRYCIAAFVSFGVFWFSVHFRLCKNHCAGAIVRVANMLAAALFQVGPNWTCPVIPKPKSDERQQQQQDSRKVSGKVTPGRAVSGAMEDELAGKTCGYVIIDRLSHRQVRGGQGRGRWGEHDHHEYKWSVKTCMGHQQILLGFFSTWEA